MLKLLIQVEPAPGTAAEVDQILPVLISKMCGDLPDRQDTATLAYVTLKGLAVKLATHRQLDVPLEIIASNDAAKALHNELRRFFAKNDEQKLPYPFVSLIEVHRQVMKHLAAVEEKENERRAELLRSRMVPVRRQRQIR